MGTVAEEASGRKKTLSLNNQPKLSKKQQEIHVYLKYNNYWIYLRVDRGGACGLSWNQCF